jgi:hypothetical protein
MIENKISFVINENIKKIMEFIMYHNDEFADEGNMKSIRKISTSDIKKISDTQITMRRKFYFASIFPEFINNILGDILDDFLVYEENVLWDLENHTSKNILEQINKYYEGEYNVQYIEIDDDTTQIDIEIKFNLLISNLNIMFGINSMIETVIVQIFIGEMKNFYKQLEDAIKNRESKNQNTRVDSDESSAPN